GREGPAEPVEQQVHRDRERDGGSAPPEGLLQRDDQHAGRRADRGRGEQDEKGDGGDDPAVVEATVGDPLSDGHTDQDTWTSIAARHRELPGARTGTAGRGTVGRGAAEPRGGEGAAVVAGPGGRGQDGARVLR